MSPSPSPSPTLPSLSTLSIPLSTFHRTHAAFYPIHLATGAQIILPTPSGPKILLLRRHPRDSNPLRWEAPGGGVDTTDECIVAGLEREVLEETGLHVSRVRCVVSYWEWDARWTWWRWGWGEGWWMDDFWGLVGWRGKGKGRRKRGRFTFLVEVEEEQVLGRVEDVPVKLAEGEHLEFRWVDEEAIDQLLAGKDREMEFTSEEELRTVKKGFECWKDLNGEG